jgi:small neutral amino acid transporter SnatA (MarC family)
MMRVGLHLAVYAFMVLVPIVNAVGTAPIFLALTAGASPEMQHRLSWRVSAYACALLVVSLVLGGPMP